MNNTTKGAVIMIISMYAIVFIAGLVEYGLIKINEYMGFLIILISFVITIIGAGIMFGGIGAK